MTEQYERIIADRSPDTLKVRESALTDCIQIQVISPDGIITISRSEIDALLVAINEARKLSERGVKVS